MKRIYVVAAGNERGGAASHIATWSQAVKDAGLLEQFRFVMVGEGYLSERIQRIETSFCVTIPSNPAKAVQALRHLVRRDPSALIHAHGPRLNVLARFAAGSRTPWTSTLHSHPYNDFLGSRVKSMVLPRLNLWSLRRTCGVFVVNPLFSEFVPNRPTMVVPNSIPTKSLPRPKAEYEVELRRRLEIPAAARVVGIAARFDPVKDIPTLIRAVHRMGRPEVHLAIAGDGAERGAIERLIHDLGMQNQVHLLGFIDDVFSFYAGLDIHVLASRSEGTPTSLLEAGQVGVPNVGSRIPGITRMITEGETGLCFTLGDGDELASKLSELLDNGELVDRLVARFQSEVLPNYTPEAMLTSYMEGYRQFTEA